MGLVLFVQQPTQSIWVNFLLGISGLGVNLSLLLYIHAVLEIRFFSPQFSSIWKNLKDNFLLFFSNLASHISINGGLIILSFFSSAATLGMYSLAERVVMILRLFPALIIQAIFPNAAKLYQADQRAFFSFLKKVYLGTLTSGALISIGTYLAAPWIIQVLSRGELTDAVGYLRLLAAIPFLACLNVGNQTIFLVTDLKDLLFRASWMFCAYMICTSTILIHYFGAAGLCFGILSTELMVFFICLYLLYRHKKELLYGFYS